ncbi:GNAT family N-acetyltransferase [Catenulispora pinisilvae]|uniref:GNAT family N-acetyltransferase n=1 Tax=Catenulispora pinisilvae TaxID=2705253 RepID=UPI001890C655|nr:GNAT family N-acetyltransferase [Catenulispora pinisilvae]
MFRESTTTRLVLKPLTEADAAEMAEVLAAPELYTFIGGEPPTADGLRIRYTRLAVGHSPDGSQEWVNWIARRAEDGAAVGTVQATIVEAGRRADIAWVVGLSWQGRGYAVEAASALVAWLRERGVAQIRANIHPGHAASARVAERIGLAPTGELDDEGEQIWRAQGAPEQTDAEQTDSMRTETTR